MSYDQAYEKKDKKGKDIPTVKVRVYSQFETFFEDSALSVTGLNKTGPFDVLPGHANFLSLLMPGDVVVRKLNEEEEKIPVDSGIIHVTANEVTVFVDI